jgi:predicted Zn-dependent peptidase
MIDRTIQPPIYETKKPLIIKPVSSQLNNDIPVHFLQAGTQEVTRLEFIFDAGLWYEDKPLQAVLTNAMMQEGSANYSGAQIAEIFDFRGAYIQFVADHHLGTISLISLNKHLHYLLPIVEDLIKRPSFDANEFETLAKRRKQRFLLENEKVKVLCQKKFSEVLFGNDHPYSHTVTVDDFDRLASSDLANFYQRSYHAANCQIMASGNMDVSLLELLNKHFGDLNWGGVKQFQQKRTIQQLQEKQRRVVKNEAIQSAIRVGRLMVKKDHPDYVGLQVLNTVLGGYFSSRLMMNIREEKGYTYGIGSSVMSLNEAGYFVIATETDKKYVEATITEIFLELRKLREELIPEAELSRVCQYLLGEFVRDFDGPFAQAQSFRAVNDFGLGYEFYEQYYQLLKAIKPEDLQLLAQKYFDEDDFYTVIAGA